MADEMPDGMREQIRFHDEEIKALRQRTHGFANKIQELDLTLALLKAEVANNTARLTTDSGRITAELQELKAAIATSKANFWRYVGAVVIGSVPAIATFLLTGQAG